VAKEHPLRAIRETINAGPGGCRWSSRSSPRGWDGRRSRRRSCCGRAFLARWPLIEAWASTKSFHPKDGSSEPPAKTGCNGERDFHGEKRSNETHASTTDPDAGSIAGAGQSWPIWGTCRRRTADPGHRYGRARSGIGYGRGGPGKRCITVGPDKADDDAGFAVALPESNATPRVAQNTNKRRSAIDGRTPVILLKSSTAGGATASRRSWEGPRRRPGWARPVIAARARRIFTFTATAYNLVTLSKLSDPVAYHAHTAFQCRGAAQTRSRAVAMRSYPHSWRVFMP
jgi:hypothetical protein